MAAEEQAEPSPIKKSGSMMKIMIWLGMVVVSIGGGFATPLLIAQLTAPAAKSDPTKTGQPDKDEEVEFIEFDEIVAVLGKSGLSRYLKMNISLQVAKSQKLEVEKKIAARSAVLKNRILAYVSEIGEADTEGQHGHNQLRRKIQSFFNEILFDDGIERIQDVYFNEFTVQ